MAKSTKNTSPAKNTAPAKVPARAVQKLKRVAKSAASGLDAGHEAPTTDPGRITPTNKFRKTPGKPRVKSVARQGYKAPFPSGIKPMLCTLVKNPVLTPGYIHEIKWDGYRIVGYRDKGKVRLDSRSGLDYTAKYPPIADALKKLHHNLVLDGEVVVLNEEGNPDFDALQKFNGSKDPIYYYVFDILWLDGYSLMDLPLIDRKQILSGLLQGNAVIRYSEHFDDGRQLFKQVQQLGLEGTVAKRADSLYVPGERGVNWYKTPTEIRQEFIIGGWIESDKDRPFRSLLFGAYKGKKLEWIGHAGGGFKERDMAGIMNKMKPLEIPDSPFTNKVDTDGVAHWVKPVLVGNFKFATWTKSGRIRKPAIFLGFRNDKKATQVVREVPVEEEPSAEHEEQHSKADIARNQLEAGNKFETGSKAEASNKAETSNKVKAGNKGKAGNKVIAHSKVKTNNKVIADTKVKAGNKVKPGEKSKVGNNAFADSGPTADGTDIVITGSAKPKKSSAPGKKLSTSPASSWPKVESQKVTSQETFTFGNCDIQLSNIERNIWKEINKAALVEYYHGVADLILPHIRSRPQSLHLKLISANAPGLYIKDMEGRHPECAEVFTVKRKHKAEGKRDMIEYLVCNNEATLLYMINLGCIDINPWASRITSPEEPDFIWIDIDPTVESEKDDETGFAKAVIVAMAAKEILDKAKLKGFVKTSGKTGIHIYIPCSGFSFKATRALAAMICDAVCDQVPAIATREDSIALRGDKVFVDDNQNDYADTLAAPYSVRPYHLPLVSTPIAWKELKPGLDRFAFNIDTMEKRLRKKGDLFEDVLDKTTIDTNNKALSVLSRRL